MIKVDNKKTIINITKKYMLANRRRNIIGIIAIILTALLFTTIFTITGIIKNSIEEQTFRQTGGNYHGVFKGLNLSEKDDLIKGSKMVSPGYRLFLGIGINEEFSKSQVEVSYIEEAITKGLYSSPTFGNLPRNNTKEVACDSKVLELLKINPQLGEKISLKVRLGNGKIIEDEFLLSGWWKYDEALFANQIIVPESYILSQLKNYQETEYDQTGKMDLYFYLENDKHIEDDIKEIAKRQGYQIDDKNSSNYVNYGVNWSYLGNRLNENISIGLVATIVSILSLIFISGYMIIFNIFQISVTQDIRFYALLKTIGTTKKQIRKIVLLQGLILSLIGIPLGVVAGHGLGTVLSTVVSKMLNNINIYYSYNILVIIFSIFFSFVTVIASCIRPGIIASKIAPVEGVKYVEKSRTTRRKKKVNKFSILSLSLENIKRSKKRSVLVVISLTLATILFQSTLNFVKGFNMEKYLDNWIVSDFILGKASYFNNLKLSPIQYLTISEKSIRDVDKSIPMVESGKIYTGMNAQIALTKDEIQSYRENKIDSEEYDYLEALEKDKEGKIFDYINLYGMDEFPLSKLNVFQGDLSNLDKIENGIVAIYKNDDYGNLIEDSNIKKLGDRVKIRQYTGYKAVDRNSYKEVLDWEDKDLNEIYFEPLNFYDREYTIVALATMKYPMSYRYFGNLEFVMDTKTMDITLDGNKVMTYLFNVEKEQNEKVEVFLKEYTKNNKDLDFESKIRYINSYKEFRGVFLILGMGLSSILAVIAIVNFFNTIVTSIIWRRREFATLQAIGMTNKQMNKMVILEGIFYIILSLILFLVLIFAIDLFILNNISKIFWFYSKETFYMGGIVIYAIYLVIGILVPLWSFGKIQRKSIVERLKIY